jgi:hypothetical protein
MLPRRITAGCDIFNRYFLHQYLNSREKGVVMRSKGKFYVKWIVVNDVRVPPKPECMPQHMTETEWTKYFLRFKDEMIPKQERECCESYLFHVLKWTNRNCRRFLDLWDYSSESSSSSDSESDSSSSMQPQAKVGPFRLRRARRLDDSSSEWSDSEPNASDSDSDFKPTQVVRRPRGRPKGSKNKKGTFSQRADSESMLENATGSNPDEIAPADSESAPSVRRPRGRPKGSKGKKGPKFSSTRVSMLPRQDEFVVEMRRQDREKRLRRRDELRTTTGLGLG